MNRTIFLDRDGTINVDYGYVHEPRKLRFIDGAVNVLRELGNMGYQLVIVTNQSGIGRGYFSMEEYNTFEKFFLDALKKENVKIKKIYTCPHCPEDNCNCRKPKLELFYKAAEELNVDLDNSFAIGDRDRDLSICKETNVKGILLNSRKETLNDKDSFVICNSWNEIELYMCKLSKFPPIP